MARGGAPRTAGAPCESISALCLRCIRRVEHVGCWGDDGKYHLAPVEWIEYLPVERTSTYSLREMEPMSETDDTPPLAALTRLFQRREDHIGVAGQEDAGLEGGHLDFE